MSVMQDRKIVLEALIPARRGEGWVLLGILGGDVMPRSSNPDPISDQKVSFFTPIFRPGLYFIIT